MKSVIDDFEILCYKEFVTMRNKARFWQITILAVILVSFAGLVTYKVIAGTLGAPSPCPPSGTCPSMTDCPGQADVDKECSVKDGADKDACRMLSGDGSKKVCPKKEQSDKKTDCDKTKKQCDL